MSNILLTVFLAVTTGTLVGCITAVIRLFQTSDKHRCNKPCMALECWNCVGSDCDGSMEVSKFASKQICEPGAECQTTRWSYLAADGNVKSLPPVRSCSYASGCMRKTNADYKECASDPLYYKQMGCYERHCCDTELYICYPATRTTDAS